MPCTEPVSDIFSNRCGRLDTERVVVFTVLVSLHIDIILGTSDGGSDVNSFLRGEGGIGSSMLSLESEPLVPLVCLPKTINFIML